MEGGAIRGDMGGDTGGDFLYISSLFENSWLLTTIVSTSTIEFEIVSFENLGTMTIFGFEH